LLKELSGNGLAKSRKTTGTHSPPYCTRQHPCPGSPCKSSFSRLWMAESHIDLASTLLLHCSTFYFLRASHACSSSGRTGTAGRENAFTTGVSTAVIVMFPHLARSMPMSNAWSQSTSHGPPSALRILAWPPCPPVRLGCSHQHVPVLYRPCAFELVLPTTA
jgi:hypothetical protein